MRVHNVAMIQFEKFTLKNGLKVIVHEDDTTPMATVNILYDVGARDEQEEKTGFAHLFEHLMFEGSRNVENFDEPLQRAGGESNAFTNNDITNYYDTLPAVNLETAFWLESDRMWYLKVDEENLEVQRKVVCEEFKENYLNQPYGDVWHKISDLSYKVHPYKWPTIGKELKHVEDATLADVQDFFGKYYRPNNAIMVVAGGVKTEAVKKLAEKWFADIPAGEVPERILPEEPAQTESRLMEVIADVPVNTIYKTWHMGPRMSHNYYVMDLLTDVLSTGHASRFYQNLVREQKLFSEIDAYITGSIDNGLVIVEGRMLPGVSFEQANAAILHELDVIKSFGITADELEKAQRKHESYTVFSEVNLLNRAMGLAFHELLGNADDFNKEMERFMQVTPADVQSHSHEVFRPQNSNTIYYKAQQK